MASIDGHFIAGALNLRGDEALFGRNWGSGAYKFLHFEACYYQAIDFAIAHGLRAWRPAPRASTRSSAATCRCAPSRPIGSRTPACPKAIDHFLDRERQYEAAALDALSKNSPFRQAGD